MRLFRIHPWIAGTRDTDPYGALFIPPGQGAGRWDNPDLYALRYFAHTPEGAVAETFGHLATWSTAMFRVPGNEEATRALSTYELPDAARLAELADPEVLHALGIRRVTEVTERNKRRTQRLAARLFDSGAWDGITWWSYYHPSITLSATWMTENVTCVSTQPLCLDDAAVQAASQLIVRALR